MSNNNFKELIRKNKYAVNILILSIGIIVVLVSILLPVDVLANNVLISIGSSIVASSIISLITMISVIDLEERSEIMNKWGIVNIFETRSEQNVATALSFPNLRTQYDQIAFGLKSLRDAKGSKFEKKVKAGLRMRILTMDPNSYFLKERENAENKQIGEIRQTILQLEIWIIKLKAMSPDPHNIQIKYYDSNPLDYYCRQENDLFIGPYLHGKESQQTITYQFKKGGEAFRYYTEYFENLWNDIEFAKDKYDIKS